MFCHQKKAESVTNISNLSPSYLITNFRQQQRCLFRLILHEIRRLLNGVQIHVKMKFIPLDKIEWF